MAATASFVLFLYIVHVACLFRRPYILVTAEHFRQKSGAFRCPSESFTDRPHVISASYPYFIMTVILAFS